MSSSPATVQPVQPVLPGPNRSEAMGPAVGGLPLPAQAAPWPTAPLPGYAWRATTLPHVVEEPLPLPEGLPTRVKKPEEVAPWLYFAPQVPATPGVPANAMVANTNWPAASGPLLGVPPGGVPGGGGYAAAPPALADPGARGLNPLKKEKPTSKKEPDKPNAKPLIDTDMPIHGFDHFAKDNLLARLRNQADWQLRADAAQDFFMVLQANPTLESIPSEKEDVDFFMLEILRDPNAVVHMPALMAIQTGLYRHPTPEVLAELDRLEHEAGLLGGEAQWVEDAKVALERYQAQPDTYPSAAKAQPPASAPLNEPPTNADEALDPATLPPVMSPTAAAAATSAPPPGNGLQAFSTPPLAGSAPLTSKPRGQGTQWLANLPQVPASVFEAMGLSGQYAGPDQPAASPPAASANATNHLVA